MIMAIYLWAMLLEIDIRLKAARALQDGCEDLAHEWQAECSVSCVKGQERPSKCA